MKMIIHPGSKLEVVVCRADDGTNDGSLFALPREGIPYCIAKAPRWASDEEWRHNATLIAFSVLAASRDIELGLSESFPRTKNIATTGSTLPGAATPQHSPTANSTPAATPLPASRKQK